MENTANIKDDPKAPAAAVEAPKKSKRKSYHPIEVRPMTRKQIRAFRDAGLDPALNPKVETDPAMVIKSIEYIIDNIYGDLGEEALDKLEFYQQRDLATDTYTRALRGPEALKN